MSDGKTRVLLVDDHPVVRRGVSALIDTQADLEVAGEANNGLEAVQKARLLQPDVILIDLMMPEMDGIQAIAEIKRQQPAARILVLTSFYDDEQVFPAIKAGAAGYILKDSPPQELLKALRDVAHGQSSLHPAVAMKLIREINQPPDLPRTADPLTSRELDVLRLLAQGMGNDEIARALVVSERTVGTHVSSILSKLHLANRTQAALYALREGIARLDETA